MRRPEVHEQVLTKFIAFCQSIGLRVEQLTFSPIKGPAGNIEFLACLSSADREKSAGESEIGDHAWDVKELVSQAWQEAK